MNPSPSPAINYLRDHRSQSLERLRMMLRIPSVSAQPVHAEHCRQAAKTIADYLAGIGLRAEVADTGGAPAAVGFLDQAGPGAPGVLLYGHYDVQPAEPLDLWSVDPFAAEVRDTDASGQPAPDGGVLIARGSADNKGQFMALLAGVEATLATAGFPAEFPADHADYTDSNLIKKSAKSAKSVGTFPVNLKVVIEGEEEVGSPNLADLIRRRKGEFAADIVVLADGNLDPRGRPTIVYSARGIVYAFVTVRGPRHDLHSGSFGGVVANPATGLARLIGGLHDPAGRITLPGFYDGVDEIDARRRAELAGLPYTESDVARESGVSVLGGGETGRPFNERRWFRPSCDVNGIGSGYQGPGSKTIIPSVAEAKVSFRLVGRQDPAKVAAAFERYLKDRCPAGLTVEVGFEHWCRAYQADTSKPGFAAMADAIRAACGGDATWVGAGGTLPILADLKEILGADSIFLGLARDDCNLHAPNEQMNVSDFHLGGEISANFWPRLAAAMR